MAITFLQQKKTQKKLILVFVGVILITAVIVWWGLFKREAEVPAVELPSALPEKEIKINFEVLKSPFLKELQPFPEIGPFKETIPVEGETEEVEGKIGRENPFTPY